MNIPKTARRLIKFMQATEQEVVELFKTIPNAQVLETYNKKKPAIFVPGTRTNKVLLVAHYDTVFSKKIRVKQDGTWLVSAQGNVGIGADDRAGVCALWMLRKLGHSLLIVPDEEIGCKGSGHVAKVYPHLFKGHSFMIQLDRAGSTDLVYYDMETQEFQQYLEEAYPGYSYANGSYTDIVELVPAFDIAGVNISIGYYNQHTSSESLNIVEFIQTVYLTLQLLRRKTIPAFKPDENYGYYGGYGHWYNRDYIYSLDKGSGRVDEYDDFPGKDDDDEEETAPFYTKRPCELEEADVIICPGCKEEHQDTYTDMYMIDWDEALCGFCNTMFAPLNHCYIIESIEDYIIESIEDDETNTYKVDV